MGANKWSNDLSELDLDYIWKGSDSPDAIMASTYGLKNPRPFLCNTRASGEACVVFEAQGKFYIWNQIQDDVNGLKLVMIEPVEGS